MSEKILKPSEVEDMVKERTGGQAFPESQTQYGGMTLRDYFAAKAMTAIISGTAFQVVATLAAKADIIAEDYIATAAYEYADAMLKARAE